MSENGQWVLLWSKARNDLDVQPLEQVLSANREAYKDDRQVDYVPVYVGTRATVAACAGHCSVTLMQRESERQNVVAAAGPQKTGEPACA